MFPYKKGKKVIKFAKGVEGRDLFKEANKVVKGEEATERLVLKFRPAKAWHTEDGSTITENRIPRHLHDDSKLDRGIRAAFAAIGAELIEAETIYSRKKFCERCELVFKSKRSTARFCEDCRSSHDRRKEEDPLYEEKNRERAKAGMHRLHHPKKYRFTISQNRKGRKKRLPVENVSVSAEEPF